MSYVQFVLVFLPKLVEMKESNVKSQSDISISIPFDSLSSCFEMSSKGGPGGGISNGDGGLSYSSLVDSICCTQCFCSSVLAVDVNTDCPTLVVPPLERFR
jgi:hypothetical protein